MTGTGHGEEARTTLIHDPVVMKYAERTCVVGLLFLFLLTLACLLAPLENVTLWNINIGRLLSMPAYLMLKIPRETSFDQIKIAAALVPAAHLYVTVLCVRTEGAVTRLTAFGRLVFAALFWILLLALIAYIVLAPTFLGSKSTLDISALRAIALWVVQVTLTCFAVLAGVRSIK